MAGHRQNTHYAGSCCEWCDDLAQGRAIGNIPPVGMINGQKCADWMCGNPNYCPGRGYGTLTSRPSVTTAPIQEYNGFYGADGVTLSQHTDYDNNWPGWQKTFGEGTFVHGQDFANDDASHVQVDSGFTATLREHGPTDNRYPGKEKTLTGPTSLNLTDDFGNDILSEMTVAKEPEPAPEPPAPSPAPPQGTTGGTPPPPGYGTSGTNGSSTTTAGVGGDNKTMMYIGGAVVVGLLAWYLLKPKSKK